MSAGRRRLGVVLLLDDPVAAEITGLRRALGDPSLARMGPHVTLVPPVNVRSADMPAALAKLRAAAARCRGPMTLTLGRVTTFLPVNPVLYLSVGGDSEELRQLRERVFVAPLQREQSWPWVPHVTLCDGGDEVVLAAAAEVLGRYSAVVRLDRIVMMEESAGRCWEPLADAALGPPARVGTGVMAIEMTAGRLVDPEAAHLLTAELPAATERIVVTARREGRVIGTAAAWLDRAGPHLCVSVEPGQRRQGAGGHLLARVEVECRKAGWEHRHVEAVGPPGFYRARGRWAVPGDYSNSTEE